MGARSILEECVEVFVAMISMGIGRRKIDASSLTSLRNPAAQPFIYELNIVNSTFDVFVLTAVMLSESSALIMCLLVIESAVNDDVPLLFDEILSHFPLETIRKLH
jgi:hypothetical protein